LASNNILDRMTRYTRMVSRWFGWIGMLAFFMMLVSTCIDVVGAKLFKWPLPGGIEIVYMIQIVAMAGTLAMAQIDKQHIRMEFFVEKASKKLKALMTAIVSILGEALFVLLCWYSVKFGLKLLGTGDITTTGQIPLYPFAFWIALSCIPMCFVLLVEFIQSVKEMGEQ
jgi:TRAP-type C4-dicarboxylate transport system permease small subunit